MKNAKRYAFIIGGIVLLLLIVGIAVATIFHVLLEVLYVFLMILALLMIAATLFQVYSIVMLIRAVTTVRDELKPLLASVQETVGLVKDTAKTAGHTISAIGTTTQLTREFALGPSVHAVAAIIAVIETVRVFFGKGHVRSRAEERRMQQLQAMETGAQGGE